jgi:hypothetical protein
MLSDSFILGFLNFAILPLKPFTPFLLQVAGRMIWVIVGRQKCSIERRFEGGTSGIQMEGRSNLAQNSERLSVQFGSILLSDQLNQKSENDMMYPAQVLF